MAGLTTIKKKYQFYQKLFCDLCPLKGHNFNSATSYIKLETDIGSNAIYIFAQIADDEELFCADKIVLN